MTAGAVNLGLVDGQEFSAANLDALENYISLGGDYGNGAPAGTGSNGQRYYDLTNSRGYRSNGSAWLRNDAGGFVAEASYGTATNSGVSGTVADTGLAVTFTAISGRRYKATYFASRVTCTVNSGLTCFFTNGTTALDYVAFCDIQASQAEQYSAYYTFTGSGSYNMRIRAASSVATPIIFQASGYPSRLLIEDIGAV